MVRLRFTIPEIGGGIIAFVPGLDGTGVDAEGRKTLVRLVEATATFPELAKRVNITIEDMHKRAKSAVLLSPIIPGDFFSARYLRRDLAEWWRNESSMTRWKPKKRF